MVTRFFARIADLVIANGGTSSNVLNANRDFQDAVGLTLYSSGAAYGETYKIQVHNDPDATAASTGWCDWVDDTGTAIATPAINTARTIINLQNVGAIKILANGAVAAARTWKVSKQYQS
jgi:hypothetical protein